MKFISKSLVALMVLLTIPVSVARAQSFTDVPTSHPHYDAIHFLQQQGVVEGYSDGTFKPNREVNRAEALKIILLSSDIFVPDAVDQFIFPDVTYDAWYGKYALKAKNLRIVQGDGDTGFFRPGDTINLAEILKLLVVANNLKLPSVERYPYWDVPSDAWFAPYFEYARLGGWIDGGSEQNVQPASPVTRALMAELMYRMHTTDVVVADGEASYYGEKFHGRTTASGATFDASAMTAAHRTYAFGTYVKVTNVENGDSVVVEINDRGPYADDRIIDLSKAAFEAISPLSRGVIGVALEVVDGPSDSKPSVTPASTTSTLNTAKIQCDQTSSLRFIDPTTYDRIVLDRSVPNRVTTEEVITLSGSVSGETTSIKAFVTDSSQKQIHFDAPVTNGRFTVNVFFPQAGAYKLGLLPKGETSSPIKDIQVIDRRCIGEAENASIPALSTVGMQIIDGDLTLNWNGDSHNFFKVTFMQGNEFKSYLTSRSDAFSPYYPDFKNFDEGPVTLEVRAGSISSNSVLELPQIEWSTPYRTTLNATTHHEYRLKDDSVTLINLNHQVSSGDQLRLNFKSSVNIQPKAVFILPNGEVEEADVTGGLATVKNQYDVDVIPPSNQVMTSQLAIQNNGTHFVEVNNEDGLGIINVPVYGTNTYPLLPSPRDLSDGYTISISSNLNLVRQEFLGLLNADRTRFGRTRLVLDDNLNRLAQYRSDDMARFNYISHWDQNGNTANDLRTNYGIVPSVGENLALDVSLELAEYGLMRSAVHRKNILSPGWTRVGLGVSQNQDGSYSFVQIFSTDPIDLSQIGNLRTTLLDRINSARSADLAASGTLNEVAQAWSDSMASENFFDTVNPEGTSLAQLVRNQGVNSAISTYIVGHSNYEDGVRRILENEQLFESRWKDIGIGIRQDSVGFILITTIYTD